MSRRNLRIEYYRSKASGGPERKVQKGSEHRVNKRSLSSNDSNSVLPRLRKKNRREEAVTPTTSGYNLRPRKGKREDSRLTIKRKTQQGGPVRSRKGRETRNACGTRLYSRGACLQLVDARNCPSCWARYGYNPINHGKINVGSSKNTEEIQWIFQIHNRSL
ncbi:hypothetical protein TNCV_3031381 [Trichonephila clavipes]|nr:hypothetical protein TNCV_3031381 [Trichonephila clavipes]